jgi:uncharacterized protein with PQ loop repeat
MTRIEIIAQIVSVFAMVVYTLSYLQKKQSVIISFQFIAALGFSISFFMLKAIIGGILNVVAAVRAILFVNKNKLKTDNNYWLVGFLFVYAVCYVMPFTLFDTDFTIVNAMVEMLPLIGMVVTTFGFRSKTAQGVRIAGLFNEPCWLIYSLISHSVGAVINNVISIIVIIFSIIKHNKNKEFEKAIK